MLVVASLSEGKRGAGGQVRSFVKKVRCASAATEMAGRKGLGEVWKVDALALASIE